MKHPVVNEGSLTEAVILKTFVHSVAVTGKFSNHCQVKNIYSLFVPAVYDSLFKNDKQMLVLIGVLFTKIFTDSIEKLKYC